MCKLLQCADGGGPGALPHGLHGVLPVGDDLRLDDLLLLLLVQLGEADAQQLGQDLLEAEVDALAGLGRGRVRQEAVVLREAVVPVRLDRPRVLQVDLVGHQREVRRRLGRIALQESGGGAGLPGFRFSQRKKECKERVSV